jgi:hypothetical protein
MRRPAADCEADEKRRARIRLTIARRGEWRFGDLEIGDHRALRTRRSVKKETSRRSPCAADRWELCGRRTHDSERRVAGGKTLPYHTILARDSGSKRVFRLFTVSS